MPPESCRSSVRQNTSCVQTKNCTGREEDIRGHPAISKIYFRISDAVRIFRINDILSGNKEVVIDISLSPLIEAIFVHKINKLIILLYYGGLVEISRI